MISPSVTSSKLPRPSFSNTVFFFEFFPTYKSGSLQNTARYTQRKLQVSNCAKRASLVQRTHRRSSRLQFL